MKLGFSSYTFHQRIASGEMSLLDVIDWVADSDGEHLELAAIYRGADAPIPNEDSDPAFVESVRSHAEQRGVILSNLAVGANLAHDDPADNEAEIARVKKLVDLAAALGIRTMRHDVVEHGVVPGDDTVVFEQKFPAIVDGCRQIAEYAATQGITTSLENHGFFVQSSDRVRRIVHAVDRDNFKTTLDIGNFVCVDEDPTSAVPANLPYAMIVHLKDFYIRPAEYAAPDGWFASRGGKHLRGAIVGEGDIDLPAVAQAIKESGYDDFVSIEFEGHEDCLLGATRGLANARRLLAV